MACWVIRLCVKVFFYIKTEQRATRIEGRKKYIGNEDRQVLRHKYLNGSTTEMLRVYKICFFRKVSIGTKLWIHVQCSNTLSTQRIFSYVYLGHFHRKFKTIFGWMERTYVSIMKITLFLLLLNSAPHHLPAGYFRQSLSTARHREERPRERVGRQPSSLW
jgi:hypothetical protein